MAKGKKPAEPLEPFDEGRDAEPVLAPGKGESGAYFHAGLAASGVPTGAISEKMAARIETVLVPAIEAIRDAASRGLDAAEMLAAETMWKRRLDLVALASENGRLTEEEAKVRIERMMTLMKHVDSIEPEFFTDEDDDEDDGEDPGIPRNRFTKRT